MKRTVRDVMTRTVIVVGAQTPFKEIVRLMDEHRVSALPVVDQDGRLKGIVSEGDLVLKEDPYLEEPFLFEGRRRRAKRRKAAGLVASQLMSSPVATIGPDETVAAAARLMHSKAIRRLPVVDAAGMLLGIVSRPDLLKVFLREDADIRTEIEEDVIHRTLWIDPATIRVAVEEGVVTLEGLIERRSLAPVLVELVRGVDGVVGVEDRLVHEVDDTAFVPELMYPWGGMVLGPRPR